MASAEAAVASGSNNTAQTASISSCWNPLSIAAALDMAVYNLYNLGYFYAAPDPSLANLANFEPPRPKRRKVENLPLENTSTRLYGTQRGRVTFKPYSDISLDSSMCQGGSRPRGDCQLAGLKRRHDGLHNLPPHCTQRSTTHSHTVVIQPDLGCTIGNLFPEILSMIFEYLDVQSKGRVAQVSTRWRDAAYKKSVWKGMTATLHLNRSNPTLFSSLATRGIKHVQVLSLRKSPRELVSGVPNIESLNLSGCYSVSDANLDVAFAKEVRSLTSLNLSLCKEITDLSLGRIATNCKNLETIDLAGCSKITNAGLVYLAWGLPKLKNLNLRSCRQISDQGIASLCGSEFHPNPASQSLESLSLQDCQKLTDESLRYVARGLPKLKKINLSFCVSITDTGLKSLAKMASLEEVNLRSCDNISDIGIGFLADDHGQLKGLDMSFCGNVTDASLRHLASSNGLGNSLQRLSMTTCAITDEGLLKVAKNLNKLQELHLGQCVKLSDLSIEAVASGMKELTSIDLYGCPKVSDKAIQGLKKNLPKLNKLNLLL